MPEVRHGSNLAAGSDPILSPPGATPPATTPLATTPPAEGEAPPSSSLNALARPTTLEQTHTLSGDSIPVTKQISPLRRLSFALGRRGSAPQGPTGGPSNSTGSLTAVAERNRRATMDQPDASRKSLSYALRPNAEAYYDSRAAGRKEWKRRAKNLQEYYDENPDLLPQLPFTWHHGNRRWRLWFFAFVVIVDASAVPIALYYGMKYAGHVQEYIIFIIVTTIWGGPSYLEFAIRTLRLMKKERFYRPLGTDSRWCADMTTWAAALTIFVLTVLFIIGSAPRDTWLRVVAMAAVSILWCLGGVLLAIQLLSMYKIPAPFRISSTGKGEPVRAPDHPFHSGLRLLTTDIYFAGSRWCLLLHRRHPRRQRRMRSPVPRSSGRAIQGQPALPRDAPPAIAVLVHPVPHHGHHSYHHRRHPAGARELVLRRVLGGPLYLGVHLGLLHDSHVQEGHGEGEARVGGWQGAGEAGAADAVERAASCSPCLKGKQRDISYERGWVWMFTIIPLMASRGAEGILPLPFLFIF